MIKCDKFKISSEVLMTAQGQISLLSPDPLRLSTPSLIEASQMVHCEWLTLHYRWSMVKIYRLTVVETKLKLINSLWWLPKFTILLSFVIKGSIKGVNIQTTSGILHRESSVFGFESNLCIVTVNDMRSVVLCELWIHNYSETTFVLKSTKILQLRSLFCVTLFHPSNRN